jgi:excisionase family DNA binding protein
VRTSAGEGWPWEFSVACEEFCPIPDAIAPVVQCSRAVEEETTCKEHQGRLPLGPEPSGLVDAAWVAARLGVGVRFARRLVAEHRIPYIKLGGPVRFDRADVERFIENGRQS